MVEVYLSIGSNVDRDQHIPSTLAELRKQFGSLTVSSIYESQAEGFQGDPFYNLVVGFQTDLPLESLAAALTEIEDRHGRTRESKKFAPRTLDIDLILYGDRVLQEGRLILPRPEIVKYAFMLEPLAEIAPDSIHPVLGETYAALWTAYDKNRSRQVRVTPTWLDSWAHSIPSRQENNNMTAPIYGFKIRTTDGKELSLDQFRGHPLLIVNTASQCGFTSQYTGLEALYRQYRDAGLVVIGFPCNQFGSQEPGSNADIARFCSTNYEVSFPLSEKIEVNGAGAHPLFQYLTQAKAGVLGTEAIKWNFTKFLVDRNGTVVARYGSITPPEDIAEDIEPLLDKS